MNVSSTFSTSFSAVQMLSKKVSRSLSSLISKLQNSPHGRPSSVKLTYSGSKEEQFSHKPQHSLSMRIKIRNELFSNPDARYP
jgi:hypothetical protein